MRSKEEIEEQIKVLRKTNMIISHRIHKPQRTPQQSDNDNYDYTRNLGYIHALEWVLYSPLRNG
jgi:hypothetical protein